MANNNNNSRSHSSNHDFHGIVGIGYVCRRAYKSFLSKLYPAKNLFSKKAKVKDKVPSIDEPFKGKHNNKDNQDLSYSGDGSPRKKIKQKNFENFFKHSRIASAPVSRCSSPVGISRTMSGMSQPATPASAGSPLRSASHRSSVTAAELQHSLYRNASRRSTTSSANAPGLRHSFSKTTSTRSTTSSASAAGLQDPLPRTTSKRSTTSGANTPALQHSLSRTTSRRSTTPIMFSNSHGLIKPPPMEMVIECTLEELCFGCIKNIKIARDEVTDDGQITEGEEVLTIKVKPGWRNGTKITFEGKGDQIPGAEPADVVFEITEREHSVYRKEGDNLRSVVTIPLVKALTGGDVSIPLLGGEELSLTIDEIIHPGYQKTIAGQGMPKPKEQGHRGDLIVSFIVEFPEELTDEQRTQLVSILDDDACYSNP